MKDEQLREIPFANARIYDGKVVTLERWQVTLPNGGEAMREVILHNGACAIVPVDAQGRVTLVRQHRVAIDRITTELPAGKFDSPSEEPERCARRELEEETGLRAQTWRLLNCIYTTPAFCKERIFIYLATGLSQADAHPDEDEFLNLVRMPLDEAVELVMRGEIRDAKTCTGLLMAQRALRDGAITSK